MCICHHLIGALLRLKRKRTPVRTDLNCHNASSLIVFIFFILLYRIFIKMTIAEKYFLDSPY